MAEWMVFGQGLVFGGLGTVLAVKCFPVLGLLDFPQRYGLKRERLPYPGGLMLGALALIFLLVQPGLELLALTVALLGVISFVDDRRSLSPVLRLLVHIGLALILFSGGIRIDWVGNPLAPGTSIDLSQWVGVSLGLTVVWIVAIQQAMNWFDGIKGSTVGVSGVGFLVLGLFGLYRQEFVGWEANLETFLQLSFYLAGLCGGGFLFFWKGKILLGDTGSQVLGLLLAVASVFAGTKIATTLLVLGLPVLDLVFVTFRRIFVDRKMPYVGDLKHLPHNLARRFGEEKACLILVGLSGLLGGIAIFLTGTEKLAALLLVIFLLFSLNYRFLKTSYSD